MTERREEMTPAQKLVRLRELNARMDELDAARKAKADLRIADSKEDLTRSSFEVEHLSRAQIEFLKNVASKGHAPAELLLRHWNNGRVRKPFHEIARYVDEIHQARLLYHVINPVNKKVPTPIELGEDVSRLRDEVFDLFLSQKRGFKSASNVLYGRVKEESERMPRRAKKVKETGVSKESTSLNVQEARMIILKHLAQQNIIPAQKLLEHIESLPSFKGKLDFIPGNSPDVKLVSHLAKLLGFLNATGWQSFEMKNLAHEIKTKLRGHELEEKAKKHCPLVYRIQVDY